MEPCNADNAIHVGAVGGAVAAKPRRHQPQRQLRRHHPVGGAVGVVGGGVGAKPASAAVGGSSSSLSRSWGMVGAKKNVGAVAILVVRKLLKICFRDFLRNFVSSETSSERKYTKEKDVH